MRHISSTKESRTPGKISSATLWMFWHTQHKHAPGSVYSCTASVISLAARGSGADFATVATAWAWPLLTAGLVAVRAADIRACNQQVRNLSTCALQAATTPSLVRMLVDIKWLRAGYAIGQDRAEACPVLRQSPW